MRKLLSVLAFCPLALFAADYMYYSRPDGRDDADCLGPSTAGSFKAVIEKALSVETKKSVQLNFADGEYAVGDYSSDPGHTAEGCGCVVFLDASKVRYWTFVSTSGNPADCVFVGTADSSRQKRFLDMEQVNQHITFRNIGFCRFCAQSSVVHADAGHASTDVTFENCRFTDNGLSTSPRGGVFYTRGNTRLVVRGSYFARNTSGVAGVSYGVLNASMKFYDCLFETNTAATGSVAYNEGYFSNCTFRANRGTGAAESASGAVWYCKGKGSLCVAEDCLFEDNYSAGRGVCLRGGLARRCRFVRNNWSEGAHVSGPLHGADADSCVIVSNRLAVYDGELKNCLIAYNRYYGENASQIAPVIGSSTCINCTIVSNYNRHATGNQGNAVFSYTRIKNCAVIDNDSAYDFVTSNKVWSSRHTGRFYGTSSVAEDDNVKKVTYADCRFKTADGWPFAPARKSCLVDNGMDVGLTADDRDLAGKTRVFGKAIDIGCHENHDKSPGALVFLR